MFESMLHIWLSVLTYFTVFILAIITKIPILTAITICFAFWILYNEIEDGSGETIDYMVICHLIQTTISLAFFLLTGQIRLHWPEWCAIYIGVLLIVLRKREYPMLPALYFAFLSTIVGFIEHFCFGISTAISAVLWAVVVLTLCAVFSYQAKANEQDLFYITKIPFSNVYYIQQNSRRYVKSEKFKETYRCFPFKRCEAKANLVREEIQKFTGKFKRSRVYLIETHPAMLGSINKYVKIQKYIDIPGLPNITRRSFRNIYRFCDGCIEYDGQENSCPYSYLKKRSTRIVLFGLEN